ncbi:hypothetical protein D3C80_907160 [compost metagenome]
MVAKTEGGDVAKEKPKITSATIPPVKQIKKVVKKSPAKVKSSTVANGKTAAVKKTVKPGSVNQEEEQEKGHS